MRHATEAGIVLAAAGDLKRPVAYALTALGIAASLAWWQMPAGLVWLPALYYLKLIAAHAVPDR